MPNDEVEEPIFASPTPMEEEERFLPPIESVSSEVERDLPTVERIASAAAAVAPALEPARARESVSKLEYRKMLTDVARFADRYQMSSSSSSIFLILHMPVFTRV